MIENSKNKTMRKITIDELHVKLLDIAKVFHQICEKHQIPYYMISGTMLGAFRHRDIIPWDDDMDFGVPREYYDKLPHILTEELPSNMYVANIDNAERIKTDTFKIVLKNTLMVDSNETPPYWGIFIDIFPLDYTSLNTSIFSKNMLVYFMVKYSVFAYYEKTPSKTRNAVGAVVKFLNPFSRKTIVSYTQKVIKNNSRVHKDALINFGCYYSIKKELMDIKIWGKPTLYRIGDIELYGVEHPHEYLGHLYGDYMELPPVEKRHFHCDEVWVETNIK